MQGVGCRHPRAEHDTFPVASYAKMHSWAVHDVAVASLDHGKDPKAPKNPGACSPNREEASMSQCPNTCASTDVFEAQVSSGEKRMLAHLWGSGLRN